MRRTHLVLAFSFLLALSAFAVGAATVQLRIHADEPDGPHVTLDGEPVRRQEADEPEFDRPIAVMIDNVVAARPQIGLDSTNLVYELLVEGGISRFMAVYQTSSAARIEPVRSARTPFLYLASELDAVLAHVGAAETDGPSDAGSQFDEWGVLHLDERIYPESFSRDPSRFAPHNAITTTDDLRRAVAAMGWRTQREPEAWKFKDDFAPGNETGGAATSLDYAFALPGHPALRDYAAGWTYDPTRNLYLRSMAGFAHIDGLTGEQLTAKNVVVQLDHAEIVNGEGHVLYSSVGTGRAVIFQDGYAIEGTWTKESRDTRTRYWDADGKEVQFNRGKSWIAILPDGSPLSWE